MLASEGKGQTAFSVGLLTFERWGILSLRLALEHRHKAFPPRFGIGQSDGQRSDWGLAATWGAAGLFVA